MSDSWLAVGWGSGALWVLMSSRLARASSQEGSHRVPKSPRVLAYFFHLLISYSFPKKVSKLSSDSRDRVIDP